MRSRELIAVVSLVVLVACKASSSDHGSTSGGSNKMNAPGMSAASGDGESSAGQNPPSSGSGGGGGASGSGGGGAGSKPSAMGSGGDAGGSHMQEGAGGASMSMHDAGGVASEPDVAVGDAGPGMLAMGSCCMAHDTPGCSNADLQVCVCEQLTACCTDAWNEPCVLMVQQKYCQPGVRDCVCGDGDGQWGQHSCCDTDWSDTFCDQVAETKCGAQPGCL